MHEHGHHAYTLAPLAAMPLRRPDCAMCGRTGGANVCAGCGAPLALPPRVDDGLEALTGRRGSPRIERDEAALWLSAGQTRPMAVQLLDLSFSGLRVECTLALPETGVARVRTSHLDAVVEIVRSRRDAGRWQVHARLLTLRLLKRAGAFVSARA